MIEVSDRTVQAEVPPLSELELLALVWLCRVEIGSGRHDIVGCGALGVLLDRLTAIHAQLVRRS